MGRETLKNVMRLINVANNTDPCSNFVADFKRSMELADAEGNRKPSQTYKPSSMNCIRNMYYQRVGQDFVVTPRTASSIGITNQGSDIHVRIQRSILDMKERGMDCDYVNIADFIESREIPYVKVVSNVGVETKLFHEKLKMSFMCDGIIKYKGHYYIVEIKTETSSKWYSRTEVDPKHYNQAIAYGYVFGVDVMFLYVNRDMFDIKAYLFSVTDEMKRKFVERINECEGYVERQICPPKPTDIPRSVCSYCQYKSQCGKEAV